MVVAPSFAQAAANPLGFSPLANETGSGDEVIITRGERGPILDVFFNLQEALDEAAAAADVLAGAPLPLAPGQTTEEFFNDLALQIAGILAQGGTPTPQQVADLGRAYLHSWSDAIEDGVRNWGEFGLLTSKGLFDADNRRYWQNFEARNEGADVDQSRADAEGGVGIIDSIIASLDDPNGDGDREDSFIDRHLVGDVRHAQGGRRGGGRARRRHRACSTRSRSGRCDCSCARSRTRSPTSRRRSRTSSPA